MLTSWLTRFILMLCLSITACTGYAPPHAALGMNKAELMAHMGPAEQERKLDTGSRLEYPRGPFGEQTWFVYLDAAGTVTRTEQVLTTENFDRISEGMAQDEVRLRLGRPSETFLLGRDRGVVWNYRYTNIQCVWFQVEISQQQQVRSAGYGIRPECLRLESV